MSKFVLEDAEGIQMVNQIKRSVFIECREWFDKTGGNTYFSARIWVDGNAVATLPCQNGYGDQYLYDAQSVLAHMGYIQYDQSWSLFTVCNKLGVDLYTTKTETTKSRMFKEAK